MPRDKRRKKSRRARNSQGSHASGVPDKTPKELEPPTRSPPPPPASKSKGTKGFVPGAAATGAARPPQSPSAGRRLNQNANRGPSAYRLGEAKAYIKDMIDVSRKSAGSMYRGAKSASSLHSGATTAAQPAPAIAAQAPPATKSPALNAVYIIDLAKKSSTQSALQPRKTLDSQFKTTEYRSPAGAPRRRTPPDRRLQVKKSTGSLQSIGSAIAKATGVAAGSRGPTGPIKDAGSKRKTGAKKKASVQNLDRLIRDGRKTPEQYRKTALAAGSPSQLSLRSISEFYNLGQRPDNFTTIDEVFLYRGYKKLNKIDEGAFGVVSRALRVSDNLSVAVKEVDLRRKKAKRIEEMKRELFVLQTIDSANVVKLVEHFIIGQLLVIIMEFCAGGNLTSYLKETAVTEPEAMFLFSQMALSIRVLHRKGIAHRDVKLNNFLLDKSRKLVKIGDFGLSVVSFRAYSGVLMAKTYCGTEPYMAPELLKRNSLGLRSYNPIYADIWSLGVCLYAMLTRTFPFKMHTSQQGLLRAQTARNWRFPKFLRDTLSEELKDLIWHMLDPEPDRRITINGVLAHGWLNDKRMVQLSKPPSEYGLEQNQVNP